MTTMRVARRDKFAMIDRRSVNDERLSYRARGVLTWLLDKGDGWRFDAETVADRGTEGRDAIRAALRELREYGYIVQTKVRRPDGRMVTETVVYEHPAEAAAALSPSAGKPPPVEPPPTAENPTSGAPTLGAPGPLLETDTETETDPASLRSAAVVEMFPVEHADAPQGDAQPVELTTGQRANAIARHVFDTKSPRPGQPFVAVLKIAQRLIEAGHADDTIKRAMLDVSPISIGTIEFHLSRTRQPGAVNAPTQDRSIREVTL